MSKRKTVREFLLRVQQKLPRGQSCWIRICDLDKYEHLCFWLGALTDFDSFSGVYEQDLLDADISEWFPWDDEDMGDTIIITADIEL